MRFSFLPDNMNNILGTFTKAEKRLGAFIDRQDGVANVAKLQADAAEQRRATAVDNISRAQRTKAKIAELIG